jgi:hypothetical protein
MSADQPVKPKLRLRWYQYRLRTLLIITTAFAAFLSWRSCLEYRRQALIAEIKALGGNVTVAKPTFFPAFSGERVTDITFPYGKANKIDLNRLKIFSGIKTITFRDVEIENARMRLTLTALQIQADKLFDGSCRLPNNAESPR